jgi:hypothetical protein
LLWKNSVSSAFYAVFFNSRAEKAIEIGFPITLAFQNGAFFGVSDSLGEQTPRVGSSDLACHNVSRETSIRELRDL